ncbi:MAG: hypothetical protein LQ345_003032 [Seirophora villosa]|nr:MAG: hypothetical protein LQ345_003032 [Seirophora villosa]
MMTSSGGDLEDAVAVRKSRVFAVLFLLAAYLRLSSMQIPQVNPQVLHLITFFLLTLTFYWILDTTRRRLLNFTLLFITVALGLGSEALQLILPNSRYPDPVNVAANILGSLVALALCSIYHKRMLDRRRRRKGYGVVPQDGEAEDLELGPSARQETGVVDAGANWDDAHGRSSADGEGRLPPGNASAGDEVGNAKK